MSDIATALTGSLCKNGEATPTANQPMGGYLHTGVGDGTALATYATCKQVQNGQPNWLSTVAGTNTITATCTTLNPASYVAGQWFLLKPANTNTGAVTLNVNSLGAKAIQVHGNALDAGNLNSSGIYEVVYDGTQFQLVGGQRLPAPKNAIVTRDVSTASGTQAVTGVGFKPRWVKFTTYYVNGSSQATVQMCWGADNGTNRTNVYTGSDGKAGGGAGDSIFLFISAGNAYSGLISSMDTDGFTITWTKTGTVAGTLGIMYEAYP
jgi:hypothetical protein